MRRLQMPLSNSWLTLCRNKLAQMAARVEALQAWVETLTFQLTKMDKREANDRCVDLL